MSVLKLAQHQFWEIVFHTVAKCGVGHQFGASIAQAAKTNSAVLDSDNICQCKGKHGLTAVLSCWHPILVRTIQSLLDKATSSCRSACLFKRQSRSTEHLLSQRVQVCPCGIRAMARNQFKQARCGPLLLSVIARFASYW